MRRDTRMMTVHPCCTGTDLNDGHKENMTTLIGWLPEMKGSSYPGDLLATCPRKGGR